MKYLFHALVKRLQGYSVVSPLFIAVSLQGVTLLISMLQLCAINFQRLQTNAA